MQSILFRSADRLVNDHYLRTPVGVVNLINFTDSTKCGYKESLTVKRRLNNKHVENNKSTKNLQFSKNTK